MAGLVRGRPMPGLVYGRPGLVRGRPMPGLVRRGLMLGEGWRG